MSKRLVLASNNAKKAAEMQALLAPLGIEVFPQSVFGVGEAEEPHPSFVENALAKARHASAATGLPAVADDSACAWRRSAARRGHPARFAGEPRSDARNNALLLEKPRPPPRARTAPRLFLFGRGAGAPRRRPAPADRRWRMARRDPPATRGEGGFGHDPLFWVPELEQTAAELDSALKNTLSHRGAAMRHLLDRPLSTLLSCSGRIGTDSP